MQIDVISDTVCPWCFIGKRRLQKAMALRPEIVFDVRWRPYQLDATVPRGGMDRQAYMRAKFGDRYHEANTLTYLGDAHRASSGPDAARHAWRQALAILDELDHPDAQPVQERPRSVLLFNEHW